MTTSNLPAFPINPMEAVFTAQRAWFDQVSSAARVFMAQASAEEVRVNTGDINFFFPFGYDFRLFANPTTAWFSGIATAEREKEEKVVTGVASYGKQLGRILAVVVPLAEQSDSLDKEDVQALKRMHEEIRAVIED